MAWYLLARALFVIAVTYAALLVRPFAPHTQAHNNAVGAAIGLEFVIKETTRREAEVT